MNTFRFGIIGTGSITKRFIKGALCLDDIEVNAVLSRNMENANTYASAYENMQAFDNEDAFLNDAKIDAVYIATPNFTHKDYIMKALLAHKHVICEKPMMLNEADVHECFAYAKAQGCVLMEAMKPCFLPTTIQAKKWIQEGRIGNLRYIEAGYCSDSIEAFLNGWHADLSQGGGALYDIGVYPLGFVNEIISSNIIDVQVSTRRLKSGIDAMSLLQVKYDNGVLAQLKCAIDTPMLNKAIIHGDAGTIEIENFWKSDCAQLVSKNGDEVFYEPHHQSEFQYQIAAFVKAIQDQAQEQTIMSEHASARNAWVIDQVHKKWRNEE